MAKYVLQVKQRRPYKRDLWRETLLGPFETLEEAKACLAERAFPNDYRIAEAYTVTRYKAVKL